MSARRGAIRRGAAAACAFALAVWPAVALAWNNQGHMATGALAYDALMRMDPAAVRRIVEIEAANPEKSLAARVAGLSGPARDRALFEWMARWPDDIRRGPLDHPDWHYSVHVVTPVMSLIPYTAGKAVPAFDANVQVVEDPHASAADKAIALCWIMHIAGDIQQPLHAGNWISLAFPKSDRAGTIGYVRNTPGGPPRSLHDAWDGAADMPLPEVQGANALTAKLEQHDFIPFRDPGLRTGYDAAIRQWRAESLKLATDVAYTGDALKETPTPADAPVLSAAYQAQARALADTRIRLGGLRIAAVLDAIVASS